MSGKIVFISDFFVSQVSGGAEIYDSILIEELESDGCKVCTFNSKEFTVNHLKLYLQFDFHFLISNFINLGEQVKKYLQAYGDKYCILEHDHKYVVSRNPAVYSDFTAPKEHLTNVDFYSSAKYVFCQSNIHKETLEKNLEISNVINLSCSLWSASQLSTIRNSLKSKKTRKNFILGDLNPIKGLVEAKKFCEAKGLEYDVVEKKPYSEFISTLSQYEKLVFFPKTLESFCRLVLEARMLDCGLFTNNLNGCTQESWFRGLKGEELIDFVESKRSEVVSIIREKLLEEKQTKTEDITVILNCYRRPYNLKTQVDSLKSQSIKPKQIWLWVNHHEENKSFDFSALGVDRIFNNDHNWKFYGRFAAALLADTEYVAIYDDDTIPGNRWHENCLETMKETEGIMGSAGIILKSNKYTNHDRCGWPTQNEETTEVDLVGHSWFFKREWLRYLWQEKPVTWDNGEDIQFGFMSKIYGGISTFCPPHPAKDKSLHGSILGNELGIDNKATSTNSSISHQQFFSERDNCISEGIKKGWKTVMGIK